VDDRSLPGLSEGQQEGPVEAYRGHEVEVEVALPVLVGESQRSLRAVGLTAGVGDQDVQAPEQLQSSPGHGGHALGGRQIGGDAAGTTAGRDGARGDDDLGAGVGQPPGRGGPDTAGPAGDQRASAGQIR